MLTFVVVGGGPTGVELAGALIEIAVHSLGDEFDVIEPAQARVILEGAPHVCRCIQRTCRRVPNVS